MKWACFEAFHQECCNVYPDYEPNIEYCRRMYKLVVPECQQKAPNKPEEYKFWEDDK